MRDTSKPANGNRQDRVCYSGFWSRKARKGSADSTELNYAVKTWAEDRALQGWNPSADSAAGMAGGVSRPAPQPYWRYGAKSGEREGSALASKEAAFRFLVSRRGFGAPAPGAALEHVAVMQQPIEHRADCGDIAE